MRTMMIVGLFGLAGCGFSPQQNYKTDSGSDRAVIADTQSNDLQDTVWTPDAVVDITKGDLFIAQHLDAGETGRPDVTPTRTDLAATLPDAGPDAVFQPDTRAPSDVLLDFGATQPDAIPDSYPDVIGPPDVATDIGPDLVSRDSGFDLPKPCSGCADPAWACSTCMNSNPKRAILVQCVDDGTNSVPYDCNGQAVILAYQNGSIGPCGARGSASICLSCTESASLTCAVAGSNCTSQLHCPDEAPYCNTKTGECSKTMI
jgi:hypothetical protein